MQKKTRQEVQLSLFGALNDQTYEVDQELTEFEQNIGMNPEDYKRWIKQKIHAALKSME